MNLNLPENERTYLKQLARQQADYAALPVMEQRRQLWLDHNDGKPGARPPVIIETWTFDVDYMPNGILKCQSDTGKAIEAQLVKNIRNHELIDDDKVCPDYFEIGWFMEIDELGFPINVDHAVDVNGGQVGYQFQFPFKDLPRDLERLKPARCSVDREKTMAWKAFLEELFDGILKVKLVCTPLGNTFLTQRVVTLMGMEAMFVAMYDTPDEMHQLMGYLRDNALRVNRWAESEGLLRANNENQQSFGSSYNWTKRIPGPGKNGGAVELSDMWGSANSQETVGVSPSMYHEFCFPYYRDALAPLGLVYYGCCEPTHPFWEDIRQYPHLKKVSINRWTDQKFMGNVLRGTDIVFSRKPDPNFLGVDVTLREDAWAAHIRETLEATKEVFTEFIIRDVYTLHGNLGKAKRAVEIVREEIQKAGR